MSVRQSDSDDTAGATGWFPNGCWQAFDSQQRPHRLGRRLVQVVLPRDDGVTVAA
jgi:hypothetical protein